jgi:hypothetical protein
VDAFCIGMNRDTKPQATSPAKMDRGSNIVCCIFNSFYLMQEHLLLTAACDVNLSTFLFY